MTYGATSLARAVHYPEQEKAMLKISVIDSARQRRLLIEGKLIAPWAAVLRSSSEKARPDLRGRELIIELNMSQPSADRKSVV